MSQPLTHPTTNADGTCSDAKCPCHEFVKQEQPLTFGPGMVIQMQPMTIENQKRLIQVARKGLVAEMDRLQLELNRLDAEYDELEDVETRQFAEGRG